ncbi:TonB-dependent receptor [Variovorax sp. LjRoot290]|uniref:TonB-dependent siderophore receptor n=1 Tax=Variovorax sp. LjRoot290 TaxID=3342316 RepID=UPI003ECE2CF7
MGSTKTALALAMIAAFPLAQAQSDALPTPQPPGVLHAAPTGAASYAQTLVESTAAMHPELIEIDLHATPSGATQGTIVAAKSPARIGRPDDDAAIAVFRSGEPRIEINRRGDGNVDVQVQLFDIFRQTVGSVAFTFPYPPETDPDALVKKAGHYRDEMSRRIFDAGSLMEPAQLDPRIPLRSYAQFLVDDLLRRHPGIEVIALHARTPRTGSDYPIVASNIGRIGRPADEGDLAVVRSGQPYGKADARGARFEVKVPVKDASGAIVGALGVVFPLGAAANPEALQRRAEAIAAEMGQRIASAALLEGPYPATALAKEPDAIEEYNKQELGNKQNLPMTKEVASGQAIGQTQEGYSEAIKNQAGVQATNSAGSANDAFAIRGIKLNLFSNYRLDGGLPVAGVITNPTENKERVETLKGANALMFGVASPAGIINFVTKRAGPRDITTVGAAGNSFGQYGLALDLGRRFGTDEQVGVRLNASATHLENGVRDMGGDGSFASLGVDVRVTPRLTLQGDFEHYRRDVPEQAGIALLSPVNGVIPLTPVPSPRNLLSGTWNLYTPRTTNIQGRADYVLNDDWKVLLQGGQSQSERHRNTVRIRNYNILTGAGGIVTVQPIDNDYTNTFWRTEVLGKFRTWGLTHDLTIGLSSSERESNTSQSATITLPQRQNIYNPIRLNPPLIGPSVPRPMQSSTDTGLYGYDTIGITDKLKMLLGVRRVQDKEVFGSTETKTYHTSPAYGVLYDIRPTTTLFASYMEGLEAGATAPANAANANEILPPAISKQKEIGIRDSYFKGLQLSVSYFDIMRANAVTDPATGIFGYNGNLSYKGIEATASYEINRDWKVNAAVLRLNAKQDAPGQPLIDGKAPENTPKWNANFGVSYRVAAVPGLTVRAGMKIITKRPLNAQNQGYLPGTTLYDAGLSYATRIEGRPTSFSLSIDNLTNKRYWNSVADGTYGIGMDRSIRFNAKVNF